MARAPNAQRRLGIHSRWALPAEEVVDRFVAIAIKLIAHDEFVSLNGDILRQLFPQLIEIAELLFQSLRSFSRALLTGSTTRRFEVRFQEDLTIPLSINIFGYRSGRVRLTRMIAGGQRVL